MSKIIVIDPGHGGSDPGAIGNGLREKILTLDISKRIKKYLDDNYTGHKVLMTRTTDKYLTLAARAKYANDKKADFFMSVHINAGGGTGYESFIHNKLSNTSATAKKQNTVHAEAIKKIKGTDRGKKKANFAVLRLTNMSAILPENLFIDRKEDAAKLKKQSELQNIAEGHAIGIAKSLGLSGVSASIDKPKKDKPSKQQVKPEKPVKPQKTTGTIATIQDTLNKRYDVNIAVDNISGPDTKQALIIALQTELNKQFKASLNVDGIWGPKTSAAVVNVRSGAKGNLTWILQAMLIINGYNIAVDGIFDSPKQNKFGTSNAVKSFQRKMRLNADGIAGRATFTKLFS